MSEDQSKSNASAESREQATAYGSIFAPHKLTFDDGTTMEIPPHPSLRMFDDERQADYDQLMFEAESYERGPDIFIPEQKVKDSAGNELTLPADTRPGNLLVPYRRKNADGVIEVVRPPHEVKVVQAAIGPEAYELLRSKKIDGQQAGARHVWQVWNEQGTSLVKRQVADPKSDGGSGDLADVPASDSK